MEALSVIDNGSPIQRSREVRLDKVGAKVGLDDELNSLNFEVFCKLIFAWDIHGREDGNWEGDEQR